MTDATTSPPKGPGAGEPNHESAREPAREPGHEPGHDRAAGIARWVRDLAMGARFAVSGGREGWTRTALTAVGVGIGVAVLLVAASIPHLAASQDARTDARQNFGQAELTEKNDDTALFLRTDTEFHDERIRGRLIDPEGSSPPVPPGVRELPGPGEMVVSPALRDLLASDGAKLLRERLPAEITGTIADEGLEGPAELAYYGGADGLRMDDGSSATRIDTFGHAAKTPPLDPLLVLLITVACVVLLLPVGAFIAAAVRFGGERRDRRLAALRLVGADVRMTHRVAAGEAATGALLGLAVGVAVFLPLRMLLGRVEVFGFSLFTSDVRPSTLIGVLIGLAVPACAVVVSFLALRGVAIEPLGVVRRSGERRRRLWWRLVPGLTGLALLSPLITGLHEFDSSSTLDTYQIAGGIVLILLGVTALLPWLVEAVVNRLRGGTLPFQLAVRRLQLDSGTAARAVSGITVAVAGAIALQMLFSAAAAENTKETGADPARAQMMAHHSVGDGAQARAITEKFAGTRGVRDALGVAGTYGSVGKRSADNDSMEQVTVADCATLTELIRMDSCRNGDVFLAPLRQDGENMTPGARPGAELDFAELDYSKPEGEQLGDPIVWTVPEDARKVKPRTSPNGSDVFGVLATPAAFDLTRVPGLSARIYLQLDPGEPEAEEYVRNTAAGIDPALFTYPLQSSETTAQFAALQRAIYAASLGVMLLIGASMIISTLEQLRERKRLLSVLVAFGTRRSTLAVSVLWQTALPVLLGVALAAVAGLGLGSVLLTMANMPQAVYWRELAGMSGLGAALILVVTGISMPALWRLMRPDGLRTE